jgi:ribosomal protein S18 acetylase RimI-like enzyme
MGELLIEPAMPADAGELMRIKRAAWIMAYPNTAHKVTIKDIEKKFTEQDVLEGTKNWQEGIASEPHGGKRQTFVARINNKAVGFSSPCFEDGQWRIGQLYVKPEFQARGIGSKLLQTALDWLGPQKDVYLHVVSYNEPAIGLYKKFGFVKTGKEFPEDYDIKKGIKLLPEIEMQRKALN